MTSATHSTLSTWFHKQEGKSNLLFILIAVIAIGIGFLAQTSKQLPPETPEFKKIILLPTPKSLSDANFIDHNGESFGLDRFKGKWSILFFGFTNCPDVCPTTMQTLKQVKQKLSAANVWHNYQVIMVSVDPERDTTERLANYVPYFDSEFIGLSAGVESTTEFAKNVGIIFFKGKPADNGGYDVDHGASLILVNPQGKYAGVITAPHIESEIHNDLLALANFAGAEPDANESSDTKTVTEVVAANPDTASDYGLQDSGLQDSGLQISKAWIRPAPPTATSMAAYFELANTSGQDIVISSASSSAFNTSMIHETVIENNVASMKHIDSVTVPAGKTISFAPMSTHVMLMGPKQTLGLGQSAQLILRDENGQEYSQVIEVKPQPVK